MVVELLGGRLRGEEGIVLRGAARVAARLVIDVESAGYRAADDEREKQREVHPE